MSEHLRICPFCEATCGVKLTVEGGEVTGVRGDPEDVFSRGFLCPKATALGPLHADPDRVRAPLIRKGDDFEEVSWQAAYEAIAERAGRIVSAHGTGALGVYAGNPTVHSAEKAIYTQVLMRLIPTEHRYSASTVDQMPRHLVSGLLFGDYLTVPVPDIERAELLIILGANPMASNGSMWTVPDFRGRLDALKARGGRCVVLDPRRTETARRATEHHFIRPGTDALLLAAMVTTLFEEGLVSLGPAGAWIEGVDEVRAALAPFTATRVARACGVEAEVISGLARQLASARGSVYGRIGTTATRFGSLTTWLIDVVNALTGQLDQPGGAMFPQAAAFARNTMGPPGRGRGVKLHRRRSRVRQAPEVMGEYPIACMPEEILAQGEGQLRGLVTLAGNPARSAPDSGLMTRALQALELLVCVDLYINETTRHADVILPGRSPLEVPHFEAVFAQLSYRNAVRWSEQVLPDPPDHPGDWAVYLRLAGAMAGMGADVDPLMMQMGVVSQAAQMAITDPAGPVHDRDLTELMAALPQTPGVEPLIDLALRVGPYGDGFGAQPEGLTLDKVKAAPHGIDLGPLAPRLPEALRTPDGRIHLAQPMMMDGLIDLERFIGEAAPRFSLIGRRHLRDNNSWMHNLEVLTRGPDRSAALLHPEDAADLGLSQGARARLSTQAGEVEVPVHLTEDIMPGVVSLPHGYGHDEPGVRLSRAREMPGVNCNRLTQVGVLDRPSGTAALNGLPVQVSAVKEPPTA